jgi:hypothetical protein
MNGFKLFSAFFLLLIVLQSCKKQTDTSSPSIELLSVSHALQSDTVCAELEVNNVISIYSGQTLELQLKLTDNKGLSQLKIDIHENFDCHGHKSAVSPWQVLDLTDLSGTEQIITKTIAVPVNATAGTYHFQIRVLDESGNEAGGSSAYSILLKNTTDTVPPTLTVDYPTTTLTMNRGQNIEVYGNVTDDQPLDGSRLELVYFTPSGNRQLAWTNLLNSSAGNSYNYDFNYIIPTTLVPGAYEFQVRAFDAVGNSTFSRFINVDLN